MAAGMLIAATVAAEELAAESQYRAAPSAALAESAARHWLAKGQLARAINWVERMVRSPGVGPEQMGFASKVRGELKWKLGDLGYAPLEIRIKPAYAVVTVDSKELLPRTANHLLWVAEGGHTVHAETPDFSTFEQVVAAVRNEKEIIDITLVNIRQPSLVVQVQPPCDVWIDGLLAGPSQKGRFAVSVGAHSVEFRLPGYLPVLRAIEVVVGSDVKLVVQLEPRPRDRQAQKGASDVRREVTEHELNEAGEAGPDIAHAPDVDSPLNGKGSPRVVVSRDASKAVPASERKGAVDLSGRSPGPAAADSGGFVVDTGNGDGGSGGVRWSGRTKGLLLAVPGMLLLAGGAGYGIKGAQDAENVNKTLVYGDPTYSTAYDAAAKKTYTGYAALGAGAVLTGVGAAWLFGRDGLTRSGRGALLTVAGLATAAAGSYLYLGATAEVKSAGEVVLANPEYQRRLQVGHRDTLVAYGVAGAGVAVTAVGLWQWLTGPSRSADTGRPPTSPPLQWSVLPAVAPGHTGAGLSVAW